MIAVVLLTGAGQIPAPILAPVLAVGMMGAGMIGAAVARRLSAGLVLALSSAAALMLLASLLRQFVLLDPLLLALAALAASISFAARGFLFATSSGDRGWWIAVSVVAGEAAILIAAALDPAAIPQWLLVLLPAQWANMAIGAALAGNLTNAAGAAMIALVATAVATLLVAALWPRRWTYAVMFTTWLGMSALVYQQLQP